MMRWWNNPELLERFIRSFITDYIQSLSRYSETTDAEIRRLDFAQGGVLDSLEFIELSAKLSAVLAMDKSGLADLLLANKSPEGWQEVATNSLSIFDSELYFFSSGTTGKPKKIGHHYAHLLNECQFFTRKIKNVKRIMSLVPTHHIYGFMWGIMQPALRNIPSLALSARSTSPYSILGQLQPQDMLVTTPDYLSLLHRLQCELPQDIIVITSTAPCNKAVRDWLAQQPVQAFEIYGSSETGAIGYRTISDEFFTVNGYWAWQEPPSLLISDDRVFEVNDRLEIMPNGQFIVMGRKDSVVQISGTNINLAELEQLLTSYPTIDEAHVKSYFEDNRLKLKAMLAVNNSGENRAKWQADFDKWLTLQPKPTSALNLICIDPKAQRNSLGKVRDWNIGDFPICVGRYRYMCDEW